MKVLQLFQAGAAGFTLLVMLLLSATTAAACEDGRQAPSNVSIDAAISVQRSIRAMTAVAVTHRIVTDVGLDTDGRRGHQDGARQCSCCGLSCHCGPGTVLDQALPAVFTPVQGSHVFWILWLMALRGAGRSPDEPPPRFI